MPASRASRTMSPAERGPSASAADRIGARRLVEMADGDDRDGGALGQAFEGMERPAHSLSGVGVMTTGEKGDQGVDDQERGLGTGDDLLEEIDVIRDGSERPRG